IGLGGGSSIGVAKAVSRALEERLTGLTAQTPVPPDQPLIPVVAIPTTYAGSEMTAVYGVTHHAEGTARKITVRHPKIAPRRVTPKLRLASSSPLPSALSICRFG